MQKVIKNILAVLAAFGSLFSGLFWHLSAVMQLKAIAFAAATPPATSEAINTLTVVAAQQNLWAASAAAISGVFLAIAVAL